MSKEVLVAHRGGCHCGAVLFEVDAPADIEAMECNCTMCRLVGYQHLIVPASRFRLLQGAEDLVTYTFNTGTAKHYFCGICGVKSFYVPRSNPDGFSVNARCLDGATIRRLKLTQFDGEHWEDSAEAIRHLSKEPGRE